MVSFSLVYILCIWNLLFDNSLTILRISIKLLLHNRRIFSNALIFRLNVPVLTLQQSQKYYNELYSTKFLFFILHQSPTQSHSSPPAPSTPTRAPPITQNLSKNSAPSQISQSHRPIRTCLTSIMYTTRDISPRDYRVHLRII